jgi:hypothetical protein
VKKIITLLTLLVTISLTTVAQNFQKYQINNSGRYAYFPEDPGVFEVEPSEDGSDVYTADILFVDKHFRTSHYGTIMVDFPDNVFNESSKEQLEGLLIGYLDYLKQSFSITESTGYGKGHTLESNPDAIGVIDYWVDVDKTPWKIKGWVDKNTLAVMFIYGESLPEEGYQEMFLNGFRFN